MPGASASPPALPLKGIRVLDLTQALAGPFATMILADLGAEVIKVEPPAGDLTRNTPPHIIEGTSLYFLTNNRNKRGIVLDLKDGAALAAFYGLAKVCDVVIYNFSQGVVERLKIDPPTLRALNPRLVVCNMTGYGSLGPEAGRRAVDPIIQSLAGAMSITGLPGSEPVRAGVASADLSTGLYAAIGVLAGLHARGESGRGTCVETSLFHAQLSLLNYVGTYCAHSGEVPGPVGSGHTGTVPSQCFQTSDGWITVDAGFDRHFRSLCALIGRPEFADDPRFRDRQSRARHRGELVPVIVAAMKERTTAEWTRVLDAAGIACGRVNNVAEAMGSAQSEAYHAVRELDYRGQSIQVLATPLWFDGRVEHPVASPPALGEDTAEVLAEYLGYDAQAIARLQPSDRSTRT